MNDIYQKIFTRACSEELRESLSTGESIEDYFKEELEFPTEGILQSTLSVPNEVPSLNPDPNADFENSILLYEFLANLDKTQASDKRLWIYLSHVTFRKYVINRWPLKFSLVELNQSIELKTKAINFIGERWFLSGNARSLRRHAISRLWWAAYLTVSPWKRDPEYFESLETTDEYIYTKILFATQDILQQLLERRLGWSDKILIATLEYLRQNEDMLQDRLAIRNLVKELNLILGYRNLTVLSLEELLTVIKDAAKTKQ